MEEIESGAIYDQNAPQNPTTKPASETEENFTGTLWLEI